VKHEAGSQRQAQHKKSQRFQFFEKLHIPKSSSRAQFYQNFELNPFRVFPCA
jgi:hypothetical protein